MAAVVVLGAGIVGASVAYHLARRGVPVTVLEQGAEPATGVTGDSFAWVGGAGGDWPGGARELREYVLADYRRLEGELPSFTVRRTGSVHWGGEPTEASRLESGRFRIGARDLAALEPNLRDPPERAVHVPSDIGVDAPALTRALLAGATAHGAIVRYETAVSALQLSGERVVGVLSSVGARAAGTVVVAAGTGVAKICAPLPADLPVGASPATLVRVSAPPGLVRTIAVSPDFEVREVRDGELLLALPCVPGRAARERAVHDAFRHVQTAFRGGDRCRLLGHRTGSRPMPAHGPLIGYVTRDRSAYVAVMHSGVTLAPTVGRLVADEIVNGEGVAELRRCRPRMK
ncbi:NAD(P)/FAD-dependent oxidoreductase [Streptomyces sp. BH106]|uniref:NAD(P)/FAD-dependent oxidoreductase n=1 Tax=Streptomyces sp. BH106 TaxID=3410409 RepID=UPI003CE77638